MSRGKADDFLALVVTKMDELQAERAKIDEQLASLSLAYETIAGEALVREIEPTPREARRTKRKLDPDAIAKTRAYVQAPPHKGHITPSRAARAMKCSEGAAYTRLAALVKSGELRRISRGVYARAESST